MFFPLHSGHLSSPFIFLFSFPSLHHPFFPSVHSLLPPSLSLFSLIGFPSLFPSVYHSHHLSPSFLVSLPSFLFPTSLSLFILPPSLLIYFSFYPPHRYQGINKQGNAVYEVKGRHVGDTNLQVSAAVGGGATESGRPRVESPARPIQVFPALTLHPRNITLVVGAVYQVNTRPVLGCVYSFPLSCLHPSLSSICLFQVETRGGPYPAPSVEYSIANGTVANSSHAGVVTALALGTTTLTARAVSVGQQTGQRAIYSQVREREERGERGKRNT